MSSDAWTFQRAEQVEKFGEDKAPWYCGWYEPGGKRKKKSFGPGGRGKGLAEKHKKKVEAELMTGTYQSKANTTWQQFRKEYSERILAGLSLRTREAANGSLDAFERISKPHKVYLINPPMIADFVTERRKERGRRKGETVSPATINKDLRHIKAALVLAKDWGYLPAMPRIRMEKAGKKLPRYVTTEHFAMMYHACEVAKTPELPHVPASEWWRGLITTAYMTGWRIGDLLNLRREDVNLDAGTAIIRWESEGNKGKRDELVKLHPVVVEHLRKVTTFGPLFFPWLQHRRALYPEFLRIQQTAGIHMQCRKTHEHTPHCHVYGFHDFRRAFATMNADKLTPQALQTLMRHKSFLTTMSYINLARQMDEAVASLHVPEVLREAK